jgi:hypothetical protein
MPHQIAGLTVRDGPMVRDARDAAEGVVGIVTRCASTCWAKAAIQVGSAVTPAATGAILRTSWCRAAVAQPDGFPALQTRHARVLHAHPDRRFVGGQWCVGRPGGHRRTGDVPLAQRPDGCTRGLQSRTVCRGPVRCGSGAARRRAVAPITATSGADGDGVVVVVAAVGVTNRDVSGRSARRNGLCGPHALRRKKGQDLTFAIPVPGR